MFLLVQCMIRAMCTLTVLTDAAVHLEGLLIRKDVKLDARPFAGQGSNWARCSPVVGTVLVAVDNVAVVVASAVCSTVAEKLRSCEIGTDLLRSRPEIVHRVLLIGKNSSIGDENAIYADALAGVRKVECVVESSGSVWVRKAIQVPVGLCCQH
jgi:hypothetical protein